MVIRNIVKLLVATGEAVGKAFSRAVREEINASRQAAERNAAASSSTSQSKTREEAKANARLGISLQEAMQILDIKALNKEEVEQRFQHLFDTNAKEKGGTLYLQSKIYRAKERIDSEIVTQERRKEENSQQN